MINRTVGSFVPAAVVLSVVVPAGAVDELDPGW